MLAGIPASGATKEDAMAQEHISTDRLERALHVVARLMLVNPLYGCIFARLDRELANRMDDPVARARRLLGAA